jgi:hypothetical protein
LGTSVDFVSHTNTIVTAHENVQSVFDSWRTRMDAFIDVMRADLTKVLCFLERGTVVEAEDPRGMLGPYQSATERPSASVWRRRPDRAPR